MLGLFDELRHFVAFIRLKHAEIFGFFFWNLDTGERATATVLHVIGERNGVVHLVDVIASQDQRVIAAEAADHFTILEYRVSRALIPDVAANALVGWQHLDEFIEFASQKSPRHLDMTNETVTGVLSEDGDTAHARVHGIRQREIDDAELATEEDGRLRMTSCQIEQATAASSGQHDRGSSAWQLEARHNIVVNAH